MAFDSILGHDRVRGLLCRAVAHGRVPPALLFTGPDGVGKKALAIAVGRALLCSDAQAGEACGRCPACRRASRGLHPDLVVLEPSTANIKIDQVRDLVREIAARPFEARARAFVVDEAHTMTEEAANALLKSLEEPPPSSHVFLITAAPQGLLPTVRSRCQLVRMGPLPAPVLEGYLRDHAGLDAAEAHLRAALSEGSLGAALAFESETYRGLRDELLGLLAAAQATAVLERLEAAERLAEREDLPSALGVLRSLLRDVAALHAGVSPQALLNADEAERLGVIARGPLGPRAAALAEAAGETTEALRGNASKLLCMDVLLHSLTS
jgi:DNA polymerase-3 subunit delta'